MLFDGEEMKLLTEKDLNLLRGIFLMGKWVNFYLLGRIFPHPQGFPWCFSGEGGTVQQFFDIFGKKGDIWRILGDNTAGHCFVLRELVLIELFQISHNYVYNCNWTHAAD